VFILVIPTNADHSFLLTPYINFYVCTSEADSLTKWEKWMIEELTQAEVELVSGGQSANQVCIGATVAGLGLGGAGVIAAIATATGIGGIALAGLAMAGLFTSAAGGATCNWRTGGAPNQHV